MGEAEQSTPEKTERRKCPCQWLCKPLSNLHLAWVVGKWQRERRPACLLSLCPSLHRTRNRRTKKSPSPWQMYGHVCLPSFFLYFFTSFSFMLFCCLPKTWCNLHLPYFGGFVYLNSLQIHILLFCPSPILFSFLSNLNKTLYTAQVMPGVLWCFSSFIMSAFNLRAKRQRYLLDSWFSLFIWDLEEHLLKQDMTTQ